MTITEMAEKLGVPQRTVERRIQRAGIKPITREALYPLGTLEKIKDAKPGRPAKTNPEPEQEQEKPAAKPKKAKK